MILLASLQDELKKQEANHSVVMARLLKQKDALLMNRKGSPNEIVSKLLQFCIVRSMCFFPLLFLSQLLLPSIRMHELDA